LQGLPIYFWASFGYIIFLFFVGLETAKGRLPRGENCSLSIPDYFEQCRSSNNNNQVLEIIKFLQDFKDGWNKEHFCQGWFGPKKSPKLIKVWKRSSVSHPDQGFFKKIRYYFVHDMANPKTNYLSQMDIFIKGNI